MLNHQDRFGKLDRFPEMLCYCRSRFKLTNEGSFLYLNA